MIPIARNRRPRKVERAVFPIQDDLDDRLRSEVIRRLDRRHRRRHLDAAVRQRGDQLVDEPRIDERLVALDVDENVVVGEIAAEEVPRRAGDAVRPARQFRRRHHRLAAVFLDGLDDALVVCRDEDVIQRLRLLDGLEDPRDQRFAREHRQRLPRETARPEPTWNDSVFLHDNKQPFSDSKDT